MAELIDRDKLIEEIQEEIEAGNDSDPVDTLVNKGLVIALHDIKAQPTIEPEVRHGYWSDTEETVWDAKEIDGKQRVEISIVAAKCSVCERWSEQVNNFPPYMHYKLCPHCGAIMDAKQPKRR